METEKNVSIDDVQEKFDKVVLTFFESVRSELSLSKTTSFGNVLTSYDSMLSAINELNGINNTPQEQLANRQNLSRKYEDARKRIVILEEQLKELGSEFDEEIQNNT